MNYSCGSSVSFSTAYFYSPNATLSKNQLTLLSILNGVDAGYGIGATASDTNTTMVFATHIEVLSPRPQMPPQAFESLLLDPSLLYQYQTPHGLINSRALTTPSVENHTGHVARFGAVGEGRPSISRPPHLNNSEIFLDPEITYGSVYNPNLYAEQSKKYSVPLWNYVGSFQMNSVEYIADEASPLVPSILGESQQDFPNPVNTSGEYVVYEDRFRLYQLIDNILDPCSLQVRTPETVCHFLLALAEGCGFKITIYSIVESLLDHVIQSGYPDNCDFVTFCSILMAGIGNKWPTVYQEFMAENLVDLFKESWDHLFPQGPSKYPILYRICAFYAQLYVKGILSVTQFMACVDATREHTVVCLPKVLYYLTSGDMRSFEPMPL